ncbi:hypothetical protein, partial [Nonomuraea fastidiosa]
GHSGDVGIKPAPAAAITSDSDESSITKCGWSTNNNTQPETLHRTHRGNLQEGRLSERWLPLIRDAGLFYEEDGKAASSPAMTSAPFAGALRTPRLCDGASHFAGPQALLGRV